ncbi:S8 family serine peptidase [Peribacillus sp. FSL P2-0133]|uniref:S8 family serine peptidase n=1 Tax=Peribacillus sp. FSL P2-0133 TaxID=2921573 RepID=UPI0030D115E2
MRKEQKRKYLIVGILCLVIFMTVSHRNTSKNEPVLGISSIHQLQEKQMLSGKGISIAILDSGVNLNNHALNIKGGVNFTKETKDYQDLNGHGTYLAGIIASKKYGIAPKADVYAVKVLDSKKKGSYDTIIKGIQWAINQDVDIILMSLGGQKFSKSMDEYIKKAHQKGITIISAVGNNGLSKLDTVIYPAKFNEVIAVGAVGEDNKRWFKSSRGQGIDIMAPGVNLPSFNLKNEIVIENGTSVAAAYVAGVVCLLIQKENMTNIEIENTLKKTAISTGSEFEYGNGVINVREIIRKDESMIQKIIGLFNF